MKMPESQVPAGTKDEEEPEQGWSRRNSLSASPLLQGRERQTDRQTTDRQTDIDRACEQPEVLLSCSSLSS